MQKRLSVWAAAAAAAALALAASPASAHWQDTRWGMSKAEVAAAYPGQTLIPDGVDVLVLKTEVILAGETFNVVRFSFTDGRLTSVRLLASVLSSRPVERALAARYGQAALIQRGGGTLYSDREAGNSILFRQTMSETQLTYTPIEDSF